MTRKTMTIHRLVATFFATILVSSTAFGQSPAEKIVITYPSRSIASIDLYIAQERGFFRQEGLQADLVQVRGNIAVTAILGGVAAALNNVGTIMRAMKRSDIPVKFVIQIRKENFFLLVGYNEVLVLYNITDKTDGR